MDSKKLSADSQKQILDLLRAVVEQMHMTKEARNPSILKLALQNIGRLVTAGSAVAAHWEGLKKLFESLVGL